VEGFPKIPIFEKLSLSDQEMLSKLWKRRTLHEGEVLFVKGEPGSSMFLIEKGTVEISVPLGGKKEKLTISHLHEGDFFGELSLFNGQPRTASAAATEESILLEMDHQEFVAFLLDRPQIAVDMMSEIANRLRQTDELVMSLASKNVNEEMEERLSVGDRLADRIAEFGGSWAFITAFGIFLFGWMAVNTIQIWLRPFDEYPFIFLNLILSCIAAIQAPVIMMSQNRAQKKDRLKAELDYQVNLKSELMLQELHDKVDELRRTELRDIEATTHGSAALEERIKALEGILKSSRGRARGR
jgi:CRP/FNR family transcriptional regulator, cyclic AMP receptor protein